jgi:TIR domain
MAFVPGYKHDLFLSYAHPEAAWVEAFRRALSQEFEERVGKPVTIWQDSQNLRLGQNWTAEIEDGISHAAAFLAIISPLYHNSAWCRDERGSFLKHHGGLENVKVDSIYRLLKIIKAPGPGQAHLTLLKDLQHVKFFNQGDGYELPADSKEFTATIRETTRTIRELLTLMKNRQKALYLAPVPPEMDGDRTNLQNQLTDWGYNVKPEILLSPEFGIELVQEDMEKCMMAIFLLGGGYDPFVEDQIKVAQELKKRTVFWIHPARSKAADEKQSGMIARLRDQLPAAAEVLGGASIRSMVEQLQEVLERREEAPAGAPLEAGVAKVYLIYDGTLTAEAQTANRLGDMLRERRVEVLRNERDANHEQLMRDANGVLLLRTATLEPDYWLGSYVKDLRFAKQMFEKEPAARALLVSKPDRITEDLTGIDVLGYDESFSAGRLTPFIDKVRQRGAAHVGH